MTSVLGYARTFFVGGVFRAEPLDTLEAEIARFHGVLADLATQIEQAPLTSLTPEQLLQGPLADALTHAGQLALLRRMHGSPVASENFIFAEISANQLSAIQPLPAAPTPRWLGRVVHVLWRASNWFHRR